MPATTLISPATEEQKEKKDPSFFVQRLAWGASGFAENIMVNGISWVALSIYNVGMGVSPVLVGYAVALPRVWEALLGPLVGHWSDNSRSRWGRRRPFVAVGAILCAIFFALIWMPPAFLNHNEKGLFWYFLISSLLFFTGFAIYSIPSGSLAFELTTDYHERTRIQVWKNFFLIAVGIVLLPWVWRLSFYFGHEAHGYKREVIGMRYMGMAMGVIILVFAILPAIYCRERAESQAQPKFRMGQAMREAFQNRAFLILSGIVMTLIMGAIIVGPVGTYIGLYYVCQGDKEFMAKLSGITGTVTNIVGLSAVPLAAWLSAKLGKKQTLIASLAVMILGLLSSWYTNNPKHPYLSILCPLIIAPGMTCFWIMASSMIMDVCDLDELKSGLRREGTFSACYGLISKAGFALVTALGGHIAVWAGYKEGPAQTAQAILNMRIGYALISTFFLSIGIVLAWIFPITEKSARQVRAKLDARKGQASADAPQAVLLG